VNLNRKTSELGRLAEDFAVGFLQEKGYKVIDRNFRSRFGEIDIVAEDNGCLVFVEVKARWSQRFGSPEEAVTPQKLYKIRRTAEYYSLLRSKTNQNMRIDMVALEMHGGVVTSSKIIHTDA
jgi:putative endonuclease